MLIFHEVTIHYDAKPNKGTWTEEVGGGGRGGSCPPTLTAARGVARISVRWGQAFRGPKVNPSENGKVTGFGPLFFKGPIKNIFSAKSGPPGGPSFQGTQGDPLQNRKKSPDYFNWPICKKKKRKKSGNLLGVFSPQNATPLTAACLQLQH